MSVLLVRSALDGPPPAYANAIARGDVVVVEQSDLAPALASADGLITGNALDQDAMMSIREELEGFLDGGGRWALNGHLARPLLEGLPPFQALAAPKRADLALRPVNPHPIFAGIDLGRLETNRGVAGFYGRGCNPLPEGAVAINGLGPDRVPVDWIWDRPRGGRVFSHSGNDLATIGLEWGLSTELADRVARWAAGGPCLDPWPADPVRPASRLPLEPVEPLLRPSPQAGRRRRIVAVSAGTYHAIRSTEGPRYRAVLDVVVAPERLGRDLRPDDVLWVPCRTPVQRMIAVADVVAGHLAAGGTVVALGESRSDLWLPGVTFNPVPTNWWWWLDPGADLGVRIARPDHPLMAGMAAADATWHLHGWLDPPPGVEILIVDREGRSLLHVDAVSTAGCMIVSTLDPMFHHGSHFMPATTAFLDRFIPNVRRFVDE
jgi:hypothetical protein